MHWLGFLYTTPSHILIRRPPASNPGPVRVTRILIPSFEFILFADVFFVIISLYGGGVSQGRLVRKGLE